MTSCWSPAGIQYRSNVGFYFVRLQARRGANGVIYLWKAHLIKQFTIILLFGQNHRFFEHLHREIFKTLFGAVKAPGRAFWVQKSRCVIYAV